MIPENIIYYTLRGLRSGSEKGNNTLEEIVDNSSFNPDEWCFHRLEKLQEEKSERLGNRNLEGEDYEELEKRKTTSESWGFKAYVEGYKALKHYDIPSWVVDARVARVTGEPEGQLSFVGCKSLESVEVPAGVTVFALNLLKDTENLSSLTFENVSVAFS